MKVWTPKEDAELRALLAEERERILAYLDAECETEAPADAVRAVSAALEESLDHAAQLRIERDAWRAKAIAMVFVSGGLVMVIATLVEKLMAKGGL